jgi:nicotinate (nicotinamide) nucleotide adenylyltransferase
MRLPTQFESGTVVVFGGSFDPITYTHIQVAAEVINFGLADQVCEIIPQPYNGIQVWVVPCGMRPDKRTNVSSQQRLEMVSIALDAMIPASFPVFVESTEIDHGRYYPTRELMCLYRSRYPALRFKVLMGNDLLTSLHTWDDFTALIAENQFIIYQRIFTATAVITPDDEGCVTLNDPRKTKLHVETIAGLGMSPTLSNISSTEVRKRLSTRGLDAIVGLTPLEVIQYIRRHGLYDPPISSVE